MTYYEELSLSPTASTDQIRHSYKILARLLHPDQCHDEQVKHLAELQMRRLNQVFAVLTDPEERRRYDERLMGPVMPARRRPSRFVNPLPPNRPWLRRALIGLCVWGVPAVAFIGGMAVLLCYGSGARPALIASAPAGPGDGVASAPLASAAEAFAGNWSYVAPARPLSSRESDPESIELHVTGSAGLVSGHYQARYSAGDPPVESDVALQFEGTGGVPVGLFPWTGPGDSKGKVMLRLLSSDQLEVTWFATQHSAALNFTSGSAQLIRQREPPN